MLPHIHGYLFIFANTEIYVKLIEKLSRRHLINSSDVLVTKGFAVHISENVKKFRLRTINPHASKPEATMSIISALQICISRICNSHSNFCFQDFITCDLIT